MKVKIGISARHVHIKESDLEILFGAGYKLNEFKDLSQPGQYAAEEKVTIKTDKAKIENVRILGPVRNYTQVEISRTDAYTLGLNPPVRESGEIENSEGITIIGPKGEIVITDGVIIASRHIHMHPDDVNNFNINPKNMVSVEVGGEKGAILKNVSVKVSSSYKLELHLDTDDANAHLIKSGDEGTIIE